MTSEELVAALLHLLTGGRSLAIQPSLVNANIDLSQASILRVDNLTVHLPERRKISSSSTIRRQVLPPLTIEDKRGRSSQISICELDRPIDYESELPNQPKSPLRYQLEHHIIFDDARDAHGEFQVASRTKAVILGAQGSVQFTSFSAGRSKHTVYVDNRGYGRPVAIDAAGNRCHFNSRREVRTGRRKKYMWRYRSFPLDRAIRLGADPSGTALVTICKNGFHAAWLLTYKELTREGILPQQFLLIRGRDNNE